MAELSFIDNCPNSIDVDELIKGAVEARDILDDRAEYGDESTYNEDDEEQAREDIKSLVEILSDAGYSAETADDVVSQLNSMAREIGTFTERDSLEDYARGLWEDNNWPTIIQDNLNWDGVVEDMIQGATEVTINNGTYYAI